MLRGATLSETATTTAHGARQFVRDALVDCPETVVDSAMLLVSEITTTSMAIWGASAVRIIVLRSSEEVRVEVHEPPSRPVHRRYDDVTGPGDGIVGSVADRWGVDHLAAGRVVWFEVEVGSR